MIVVDCSAVVAILEREADRQAYAEAIEAAEPPLMSSASFVELAVVMLNRRGNIASGLVDRFLDVAQIEIAPLTREQALLARAAYQRYKKTAGLNFGDCFSYALAKEKNMPLLFKGNDFTKTDIVSCL